MTTENPQPKRFSRTLREAGYVIAYHAGLVRLCGSVYAALMLTQMYYWHGRTTDADGWFYNSHRTWTEQLGITRKEQERARAELRQRGFVEEKYDRLIHRMYYRLNEPAVDDAWDQLPPPGPGEAGYQRQIPTDAEEFPDAPIGHSDGRGASRMSDRRIPNAPKGSSRMSQKDLPECPIGASYKQEIYQENVSRDLSKSDHPLSPPQGGPAGKMEKRTKENGRRPRTLGAKMPLAPPERPASPTPILDSQLGLAVRRLGIPEPARPRFLRAARALIPDSETRDAGDLLNQLYAAEDAARASPDPPAAFLDALRTRTRASA